jgi:hypothetical protein
MLPLRPPTFQPDPGYPVRSQMLADQEANQRVRGLLAASALALALGGCGGSGSSAVPTPAPTPAPAGQVEPAAQPTALPGEASCPTPPPVVPAQEPAPAEPVPLGGKPAVPLPPAEPTGTLRGDSIGPVPPPPARPAPQAEAPKPAPQQAEPRVLMGFMVAPQPDPAKTL